jgi:hypothetical protein
MNSVLNVSVSGTVNVNVMNSSLTVTISGTPTINVQTSGGANIVIDKLTQSAYTERQSTLANNGATATMSGSNYTYRRGKYFPRGCRGYINYVEIYCDNSDSVAHTFTVYFAVAPGMGPVFSVNVTVAAGSGALWQSSDVNRFWNYDSMFIYVRCDSDTYGKLGYDTGTPYDGYNSSDGVTWAAAPLRYWIRVGVIGETVGDLPVSGTVNTIEIPSVSSQSESLSTTIPGTTEKTLLTFSGAGECDTVYFYIAAATDSHLLKLRVYCDGNLAYEASPNRIHDRGFTASTPHISLLLYADNGICAVLLTKVFKFRRELRIAAYAPTSNSQGCLAWALPSLIA